MSYTYTENLFVYRETRRPFITVLNNVSNFWFTYPPQLTNFVASELTKNFYTYYTTILSITVPVENYRNVKTCLGPEPAILDWYGYCMRLSVNKLGGSGSMHPLKNF